MIERGPTIGPGQQQAGVGQQLLALDGGFDSTLLVGRIELGEAPQQSLQFQVAGESIRAQSAVHPGGQGPRQLVAAPGAAAVAAVHGLPEFAQRHQQRQPGAQVGGCRLLEPVRGRHRVGGRGAGAALQDRPAAEGGLAGPGRGRAVEGGRVEALQQQGRRWLLGIRGSRRRCGRCCGDRDRRAIDLAQGHRLALLGVLAEQVDAAVGAAQPGEVPGGDGRRRGLGLTCGRIGAGRQPELHDALIIAAGLIAIPLPLALDPKPEVHPHPPGRRVEFDPLEGVGVVAAVVDTAGG